MVREREREKQGEVERFRGTYFEYKGKTTKLHPVRSCELTVSERRRYANKIAL